MTSIENLTTFFGWCTAINVGLILLLVLLTGVANKKGFPFNLIAKIFGITKEEVRVIHFHVFQQYRIAVLVLNLVPYIALKIMT